MELQLVCDQCEWSDFLMQKNLRQVAWWCAAGKLKKKDITLKEFWPLQNEQFKGNTKMDDEKIRWFKEMKRRRKEASISSDVDGTISSKNVEE